MPQDTSAEFWDKLTAWVKAEAQHAITVFGHGERKAGFTDKALADSKAQVSAKEQDAKAAFFPQSTASTEPK